LPVLSEPPLEPLPAVVLPPAPVPLPAVPLAPPVDSVPLLPPFVPWLNEPDPPQAASDSNAVTVAATIDVRTSACVV
jgi:hypothetical protein